MCLKEFVALKSCMQNTLREENIIRRVVELGVEQLEKFSTFTALKQTWVNMEKIKVNPNINVLTVQILARNEQYPEIGLFVQQKNLEPSKEVALQLLEWSLVAIISIQGNWV